ncbi:uncharacterized protein LOC123681277 [Harmonia axyridis]|uniref:uncharacterized protein LOC123681277 n=1 Tax=Harmonia axyridis TaxID=115357 RepID=UPI001E2754CD|nr:uncharacterized protein LOC123681277 [Harmonia axyridis]
MWKYSESRLLCNKFDFEVPLEDLYPANYLHPKIRILYNSALKRFQKDNITSELLLSSQNEGPNNKISLKDNLLNTKHPKLDGTAQSFIWLIEHFLGLLPLPLLAPYMNGYYFNWFYLSQKCTGIFNDKNYKRKTKNFNYCDIQIHTEISRLPAQHKLLLNEHIEFIRNISFINERKKMKNVIYYSKYFTACLLLRPFRSGLNENSEKDYYFLIIYLVLRWPYISKIMVETTLINEKLELDQLSLVSGQSFASNKSVNNVEEKINMDRISNSSDRKYLSNLKNFRTSSEMSIAHNAVQRISKELSAITVFNEVEERSIEEPIDDIETIKPKKDYTVSKETATEIEQSKECHLEVNQKEQNTTNMIGDTGTNISEQKEKETNQIEKHVLSSVEIQNNKEKFNKSQNEEEPQNTNKKTKVLESHSTPEVTSKSPENINIDTNILKRISKVGWTYTPPKGKERQETQNNNAENVADDEITNQELIENSQSESSLRKYPSVKSFKSRLSFLKIKKKKSGNRTSSTNFKYTKICS